MKAVIRHLRRVAMYSKGDGPSDGQLLEYFIDRRDDTAFETLVRRHGPMVLGVCRRVLRNLHDAEDAFQATFLVLARKAPVVKPREMVGNWLYGVAYRTALKARTMNAKRRAKDKQAGELPRSESPADEELLAQLDKELNGLPDKYRVAVVLCELEGRSRKEVARLLGVPEGTLSSRLAQAKKLLGRRLSRFGTVAVGSLLAESAASASLTPILRTSTTKAALTAGTVPAKVLTLADGVLKAMFLSKLKITAYAATLMLLGGVGASGLAYRATAQQPSHGVALASRAPEDPSTDKADEKRPRVAPPTANELVDKRMQFMKTALARFTVQVGERKEPAKIGDPCLRWTNPIGGASDGIVAVYAHKGGRPVATGQFYLDAGRRWVNEFTILAESDVTIRRSGRPFWKPSEYACKLTDLPRSPCPADKPVSRLAQMRAIAADFSVIDYFRGTKQDLRVLRQPVYRYSEKGTILDGALFIFVLGTDPECCLLLEANNDNKDGHYGYMFAPMSGYKLEAHYKGDPIWSIEQQSARGCSYHGGYYTPEPGEDLPR